MKKLSLTALWIAVLTALSAVTVWADIIPEPIPEPTPEPTPTPAPAPSGDCTLLTVLIVGVAVIAAAVIAWVIIRRRRRMIAK